LGSLTLTLPTGDLTLPVNEANQPRAGYYQRLDARFEASHHQTGQRRTDLALALQQRRNPTAPEANGHQLEALVETHPAQQGVWGSASWAALQTDGGTRYHNTSLGSGWAWGVDNGCQSRIGAEWQDRRLSSNAILSGRYSGLMWTWTCAPASGMARVGLAQPHAWAPLHWLWSVRAGTDTPLQTTRPGGAQQSVALRASARWTQWLLEAELTHTQDRTGYSALLNNNRVRHSTRALLRLEYHWSLAPWLNGWYATAGLERHVQQSNIPLFDVRSRNTYVSLRYQW
jgi:hypothetical protein